MQQPFDLKVVSESRVTWATYVPIFVFLGLSVLELGLMYATDVRQTDDRQKHRLMPPRYKLLTMTVGIRPDQKGNKSWYIISHQRTYE